MNDNVLNLLQLFKYITIIDVVRFTQEMSREIIQAEPKTNKYLYRSSMEGERSSMGDERSSMGDERSSIGDERSSMGDERSSMGNERSSMGDERSSIGDAF